jgi:cysteine desulfuration protein SufE
MNIASRQQEIIAEFSLFDDWMQKYEYLIDLARELKPYPEALKTDDHLIRGCQSRVWLSARAGEGGTLVFDADSDAIVTRGLVALVIRLLSGNKPEDIAGADLHCLKEIGLYDHLSPTRSNGLASMITQMKKYALAALAKKDAPL